MVGVGSPEIYRAKVHCLRIAFDRLFARKPVRKWFQTVCLSVSRSCLCCLLRHTAFVLKYSASKHCDKRLCPWPDWQNGQLLLARVLKKMDKDVHDFTRAYEDMMKYISV